MSGIKTSTNGFTNLVSPLNVARGSNEQDKGLSGNILPAGSTSRTFMVSIERVDNTTTVTVSGTHAG